MIARNPPTMAMILHKMGQLVAVAEITVSDQRSDQHIDGSAERHETRLISEQDQQAATKFLMTASAANTVGAGRPCLPI